ncbi:M23 family metallopeptidase [Alteriqipengyuania lutimaris]|uniref:M23 family peptidase n=1 Tax=Alteriqipengyuania lutimaris TaxID=1538146 RepID=A0A395LJ24_9SPHN|nr:M23 family metallopeptidase [Alteriqipengyuania lutimaris]MBB3034417.1 murein DD-endopeptidase MepM/ murein hydrolase activator NlpD [Alteriqipengyuania lutimaris]RDS76685.1 M23 family peptidase [Alteriqipengyuania lutimaris]
MPETHDAAATDDNSETAGPQEPRAVPAKESPSLGARLATLSRAGRSRLRAGVARLEQVDLAPDLAQNIGSPRWFRGAATFLSLSAVALAFWPDFSPVEAAPAVRLDQMARDEFRSQTIMPLALGGDTGARMAPTALVRPLADAPERPQLDMTATFGRSDSLASILARQGVGQADATRAEQLVAQAISLDEIEPGTQLDMTLGRRTAPGEPRPLDEMRFRARFDLSLAVARGDDGNLALIREPIEVDETPLRLRGTVDGSVYRSARAAGAPASAIQAYLKAVGDHEDLDRALQPGDTFDMIVSYRRAATGERQAGRLLYAGVEREGEPTIQLMRWGKDDQFFEASGVGEQRSGLLAPVPGSIGSRYGVRRHPILRYKRMHAGVDYRARHGTPIVAPTDGRVTSAGRAGGCGNAVRLSHEGGLGTRFCHMSRMAVSRGQYVQRGQIIGYVGSTGLSTGPHLHYEMYRGGRHVDPLSVRYVTRAQLSGEDLRRFRSTLEALKTVDAGAALEDMRPTRPVAEQPLREIDRIALVARHKSGG